MNILEHLGKAPPFCVQYVVAIRSLMPTTCGNDRTDGDFLDMLVEEISSEV
jgi:hypothetical protein